MSKWKKYISTIVESWENFRDKYARLAISPFQTFKFFNNDDCHLFIDWLELFSIKFNDFYHIVNYNLIDSNTQIKQKIPIPGILTFRNLQKILNNVRWINSNVLGQTDYWKY